MAGIGFSHSVANIMGRVGRKPELRESQAGTKMTHFSVACSDRDRNGNDVTTWYDVTLFGKQAELAVAQVDKGDIVATGGDQSIRKYTTKDGVEGTSIDIRGSYLTLLGWKKDAQSAGTDQGEGGGVESGELPWE